MEVTGSFEKAKNYTRLYGVTPPADGNHHRQQQLFGQQTKARIVL
jgi:hypothetical protein